LGDEGGESRNIRKQYGIWDKTAGHGHIAVATIREFIFYTQ
jgi:hypothetical protein